MDNATQNKQVLKYFYKYRRATPSEVWDSLMEKNGLIPITSIRRAKSELTKDNKLFKTDELKSGKWGKSEHIWQVDIRRK